MKPRNREINIFNMSLLDILSGALGAFCFLMLVLFPYYTPDKSKGKAPEAPPGVDPKTYEEAMARVRQMEATLKKFQDYGAQLEARIKELEARAQKASKKAEQLEYRNPFLVFMTLSATNDDDVEIFVEDNRVTVKDERAPKMDPDRRQGAFWAGDFALSAPGLGTGYFLVRDGPPGEYRPFLKVFKHNPGGPPLAGFVTIQTASGREARPIANFTKPKMLVPLAVIRVDKDFNQKIEWRIPAELTSGPPPGQDQKKELQ